MAQAGVRSAIRAGLAARPALVRVAPACRPVASQRYLSTSSSRWNEKGQPPSAKPEKNGSPSEAPKGKDAGISPHEPFVPPPIPSGVDPSVYERPEEEGGEEGGTDKRGASPFLSEAEVLKRRKQQRAVNRLPRDSTQGDGTGAGSKGGAGGTQPPPWWKSPTTLVLGFIPIFTFSLGYWQIERLKWKVSLIEELEDKLRKDPIRLPKSINLHALPQFEFRLVEVEGTFDESRPLFLGPRVRDGQMGYQVVVPFQRADGGDEVLINRGFVAEQFLDLPKPSSGPNAKRQWKNVPPADAKAGQKQRVLALLPRVYPGNMFTPPNRPERNEWFHTDANEMAQYLSGSQSRVLPVYLEEIFDGHAGQAAQRLAKGIPVGREATIELRNQHAVYAATWFSLSAATAVMFAILVRRGR